MPQPNEPPATDQALHYVHETSFTLQERVVGAFVLLGLGILFSLVIFSREVTSLFEERVTYHTFMQDAQGITTDTKVFISGLEVGSVTSFDVSKSNAIEVEMQVLDRFRNLIREDSRAILNALSVFGGSSIEISPGDPNRPILPKGARIPVDQPLSINQVFANVMPTLRAANETIERFSELTAAMDPVEINQMTRNMTAMTNNLNRLSEHVAEGRGALGTLLFDEQFDKRLADSMNSLNSTLATTEQRLQELGPLVTEATGLAANGNKAMESLPVLLDETTDLVRQTNSTMETVNKEMESLPTLVRESELLLDEMDTTLDGVQGTWPISAVMTPPRELKMVEVKPPDD